MGNDKSRALQMLGIGAALFECWEGWHIEARQQPVLNPLKHGLSGTLTRAGAVMAGPVPAILRIASLLSGSQRARRAASVSAVTGALLTRIAWIYAGHVSARDWKIPLGIR
jgi:hypothetical protein